MAILAVFDNVLVLAAEIEAREAALQSIKEGHVPLPTKDTVPTPSMQAPVVPKV